MCLCIIHKITFLIKEVIKINIFFLDFDGVTHPDACGENLEFCRLPFIERTLRPFLGEWKIVISSNWKNIQKLDQLKKYFSDDIRDHIVGVTPTIKAVRNPFESRGKEIEKFISEHNVDRFIIIDDMIKFLSVSQRKYAVTTDSRQGFTNKSRNRLLFLLNKFK